MEDELKSISGLLKVLMGRGRGGIRKKMERLRNRGGVMHLRKRETINLLVELIVVK